MSHQLRPFGHRSVALEGSPTTPSFTLMPATPSDIPTLANVTAKASAPDLLVRLLWPNLAAGVEMIEFFLHKFWRDPELENHVTKAVSPEGEIMGYLWLIVTPKSWKGFEMDQKGIRSSFPGVWPMAFQAGLLEGEKREFPVKDGFMERFNEVQSEIVKNWFLNKRTVLINAVYTLPKFQRRGVGTALMKSAIEFVSFRTHLYHGIG